ncbi:hypothetical protein P4U23_06260 [Aeribacillus composti]|uniref:hypothetical protein n=1 Tax=Aeribacillus composti TaxID=1868734 RepID=UPI002E24FBD9|nr:hypothetical protein [Aeribacillus composti]
MEETLKLILSELKEMKEGQSRLAAEQQGVKEQLKELKEGQSRLEVKMENIERKITGIHKTYENLEQFVARQQRVIEELSARSVEYGVEIKEIHRILKNQ